MDSDRKLVGYQCVSANLVHDGAKAASAMAFDFFTKLVHLLRPGFVRAHDNDNAIDRRRSRVRTPNSSTHSGAAFEPTESPAGLRQLTPKAEATNGNGKTML